MEENPQKDRREAAAALKALKQRVQWKPGKALSHLEKRKGMGHLGAEVTSEEYNRLIQSLVEEEGSRVYVYRFGSERYYAVRGTVRTVEWLVIVTREGVVETAFPPDSVDQYLRRRGFVLMGALREVCI